MDNLNFISGLLWYLKTRNWAFKQFCGSMSGDLQHFDIALYHYLYFTNLLGAVDAVNDYLHSSDVTTIFSARIGQNNYLYLRELRNAVVHRGGFPYISIVGDDNQVLTLCPPSVYDRKRQQSYTCTFTHIGELAKCCNNSSNKAIFEALNKREFFSQGDISINEENALDASIRELLTTSPAEWEKVDWETLTAKTVKRRIAQLKIMLDWKAE
jgi:hypothetical protein